LRKLNTNDQAEYRIEEMENDEAEYRVEEMENDEAKYRTEEDEKRTRQSIELRND